MRSSAERYVSGGHSEQGYRPGTIADDTDEGEGEVGSDGLQTTEETTDDNTPTEDTGTEDKQGTGATRDRGEKGEEEAQETETEEEEEEER